MIQAAFLFSNKFEQGVQLSRLKKDGITDLERFADTTAGGGTYYYADVPAGTSGNYLYLIWDLRSNYDLDLCWSEDPLNITRVCCECDPCTDPCREWSFQNVGLGSATVRYADCNGIVITVEISQGRTEIICGLASYPPIVLSGGVYITITQECGCKS